MGPHGSPGCCSQAGSSRRVRFFFLLSLLTPVLPPSFLPSLQRISIEHCISAQLSGNKLPQSSVAESNDHLWCMVCRLMGSFEWFCSHGVGGAYLWGFLWLEAWPHPKVSTASLTRRAFRPPSTWPLQQSCLGLFTTTPVVFKESDSDAAVSWGLDSEVTEHCF